MSLLLWRNDSHHLADVVGEALDDPSAQVRQVAAYCPREQRER